MRPIILELCMGADIHGHDYTKAALRAVSDAIRHSSLTLFYHFSKPSEMKLEVNIGVSEPNKVDKVAVAKSLPYGTVVVNVVRGGLDDKGMGGNEEITLAVASVKAWLNTDGHGYILTEGSAFK
jgi:uncharacterized protein (TIGR02058 family)